MPSESVLVEKKKIVEELTEKLKSKAGVFVDYRGIKVVEDTEMRVKMREANVDYAVVKNTLMRFAVKNVGFEALEPILSGTTSLAVSGDDLIQAGIKPGKAVGEALRLLTEMVIDETLQNDRDALLAYLQDSRLGESPQL